MTTNQHWTHLESRGDTHRSECVACDWVGEWRRDSGEAVEQGLGHNASSSTGLAAVWAATELRYGQLG